VTSPEAVALVQATAPRPGAWRTSGVDRDGVDPIVLLPGIGGSCDLGDPATAVHDVTAALAEAAPGRAVTLFGYSFGAVIALETAAALLEAAHSKVSHLLLVAGVLASDERQRLFASTWEALGSSGSAAGERNRATFARFAAASFDRDPFALGEVTEAQIAALARVELEASAARVTAPTLVIGFDDDGIAGTAQARRLFAAIDDCRYAEVHGGHATLLDRPAEVLSLVDGLLAGSYPSGAQVSAVSA
jgi:pimeloyl-ACP methyl ester carboxylesterase